jgi:hypothetical protein
MTGFTGTSLLLQSIIPAQNQWLYTTGSSPCWTTSNFPSTVTDLVLIYESVTSSASVFRWLTLHSWTLNSLTNESQWIYEWTLFVTQGEPKREYHLDYFDCYYLCFVRFLPRNGGPSTVDCRTSGIFSPKGSLLMAVLVTILSGYM